MTRAEAIEAFHRASLAFSALTIEIEDPSPELLQAMARAETALDAAFRAVNEFFRRMDK